MTKKYIVPENLFLELLEAKAYAECLDEQGVDNWSWFMENRIEFVARELELPEAVVEEESFGLKDVANREAKLLLESGTVDAYDEIDDDWDEDEYWDKKAEEHEAEQEWTENNSYGNVSEFDN